MKKLKWFFFALAFFLLSIAEASQTNINDWQDDVDKKSTASTKSLDITEQDKKLKVQVKSVAPNQELSSFWFINSTTMMVKLYLPFTIDRSNHNVTGYVILNKGEIPETFQKIGLWKKVKQDGELYYCTSHPHLSVEDLGLKDYEEENSKEKVKDEKEKQEDDLALKIKAALDRPYKPEVISDKELTKEFVGSSHVIFVIGAGLSAAKIWTLPDFHKKLGLEDMDGTCMVSNESLKDFIPLFCANPQTYYPIMSQFVSSMLNRDQERKPTPGHQALKEIHDQLTMTGIKVTIYSGNFDKFEEVVGLPTTRESEIIDIAEVKQLTVVSLGQKHDHAGLLNHYAAAIPQTKIFTMNIQPPKFLKMPEEGEDFKELISINGYFPGDLQETLPALQKALKEAISKVHEKDK